MRRSISMLMATFVVLGATTVSLSGAHATGPLLIPQAMSVMSIQDGIEQVREDGWRHGGWDRDDNRRYRDDNRRYRDRRHHRRDIRPSFSIQLPFAFAPRYYAPRRDCHQGWDGRLYCAR